MDDFGNDRLNGSRDDRPRARAGTAESSEIAELTAAILGGREALERARNLLGDFGEISRLARASSRELVREGGLGPAAAARLEAAFELGRRLAATPARNRHRFRGGQAVFDFVGAELRDLEQEVFEVLLLDARNGLIRRERVSVGTLTGSLVHPREVFRAAVREAAAAIVLVHNHPSGDPTPSPEDVDVTERIVAAGELIGIRVLDHVIVGDGVYVSLAERGLLGAMLGAQKR